MHAVITATLEIEFLEDLCRHDIEEWLDWMTEQLARGWDGRANVGLKRWDYTDTEALRADADAGGAESAPRLRPLNAYLISENRGWTM